MRFPMDCLRPFGDFAGEILPPSPALLPAREGPLAQGNSPPPKRKCPAKVATKWPLGTFGGAQNENPATSISVNVYGAIKDGGRYWI